MNKDELKSIISAYRRESLGHTDGELSSQRGKALNHYYGRPYGDEIDGHSKVVSKDLSETVDWIMPAIIEALLASGAPVEFLATGPEDEEAAQEETDYVNHVIMSDNQGFILLHDAIKDILILKNGYVKHYWDENEKVTEEEYKGLLPDQVLKLVKDLENERAEVEVLEQDDRIEVIEGVEAPVIDFRIKITKTTNRERVEAVPPEEMEVSKRCRGSLQDSPFTAHITEKTRSELVEMGMDKDFVYNLPGVNDTNNDTVERSRNTTNTESDENLGLNFDRSMDLIQYIEAYVKVDFDDDGIAELRRVTVVGNQIPDGKEWNEIIDSVPCTVGVAKRVPHRHIGESLDDELSDLQRIKTVLLRQILDNVYSTNNSELIVNERAHLADFTSSIPGGLKRISGTDPINGSVMPNPVTPVLDQILPVIQFIDKTKGARTGINETTTATDPDVLKQSTKGAFSEGLRQASQKVRMIIRMIAETLMKDLAIQVHGDLSKYQDIPRMIKLNGKYTKVDPRGWRERTDMKVKVGLGSGTEEEKRANLMLVNQLQQQMVQIGLVTPDKAYRLFNDTLETMGIVNPDKYVLDPKSEEYQQLQQERANQPPPPNELAEMEQVKGQFSLQLEQMKSQQKLQIEGIQQQAKSEMELFKAQVALSDKERDRESKEAIESAKLEVQAMIKGIELDIGKPGIGAGLQE